jgi:uroporphyrinogen-III synthase
VSRHAVVLRPAPGDAETAARLEAAGLEAVQLPLFAVMPLPWTVPNGTYDALLLTSANAVRHAGRGLDALRALPVAAVGAATAEAATAAGLDVQVTGDRDATTAVTLAHARGWRRIVRLAGQDRTVLPDVTDVPVYASAPVDPVAGALRVAEGSVVLLHSARAARYFASLSERDDIARSLVRVAALSDAIAEAAGTGWDRVAIASAPTDTALVAAAATLAIDR